MLSAGAAALIGAGSIMAAMAPTTVLAQGRGGMGGGHASMGAGHASMSGGRMASSNGSGFRDREGRFDRGRDDFRGRFGFRGCCFGPGPFFAGVAIGGAWGYPYYPYYGCARRAWNPYYGRYVVRYVC
jgi:hypothetical protein